MYRKMLLGISSEKEDKTKNGKETKKKYQMYLIFSIGIIVIGILFHLIVNYQQ